MLFFDDVGRWHSRPSAKILPKPLLGQRAAVQGERRLSGALHHGSVENRAGARPQLPRLGNLST